MNKFLILFLISIVSCSNLRKLLDFNTFYTELVNRHNTLRSKHGAQALTKLKALADLAQVTANNCRDQQTLIHSSDYYNNQPVGQNLYMSGGSAPTGTSVSNSWYSENVNYNYNTGKPKQTGQVIGHFTQLVWKNSKQIGCALATGPWGSYDGYFVCCNYFPAGNYNNQYIANVGKPTS